MTKVHEELLRREDGARSYDIHVSTRGEGEESLIFHHGGYKYVFSCVTFPKDTTRQGGTLRLSSSTLMRRGIGLSS